MTQLCFFTAYSNSLVFVGSSSNEAHARVICATINGRPLVQQFKDAQYVVPVLHGSASASSTTTASILLRKSAEAVGCRVLSPARAVLILHPRPKPSEFIPALAQEAKPQ